MPWKRVLHCKSGFTSATGRDPDDDLAHAYCQDDETGYCLSVSRFPDEDELIEVMVCDQIVHKTGDVVVELSSDTFRLTLSGEAAAQLDGTVEYVVPIAGTTTDLMRLDEALSV